MTPLNIVYKKPVKNGKLNLTDTMKPLLKKFAHQSMKNSCNNTSDTRGSKTASWT